MGYDMAEATVPSLPIGGEAVRRYSPSFVDRFTDWVRGLPIPSWLFYPALALALVLLHASIKWIDGSFPVGTFVWRLLLADVTIPYTIAVLHYLDDSAQEALDDFRPIMHIDEAEFRRLRYQFTTLPARPTLAATCLGTLYGLGAIMFFTPEQRQEAKFFSSPPASVLETLLFVLSYAGAAIFLYHSARQLRMISDIYTAYARVDLFNLSPMHALSKLTARTAIGLGVIIYAWLYINLAVQNGAQIILPSLFEPAIFSIIVILIFILPLLGARRLLREAKAEAKRETQQQFKATVAELHHRREAGDFSDMAGINQALDGLLKEQSVLDKTSTWPWQPETLRGVATAVLLPIVVWAITRLLERFWVF
jgi:hypothetical protein